MRAGFHAALTSGWQLQTGWNRANMCPSRWIKKAALDCQARAPWLRLMRPRCHADHTYCRLPASKSIPQTSGTRTHLHTWTHSQIPSSSLNSTAFSSSSYTLWRLVIPSISRNWAGRGSAFVGMVAGGKFLKVIQNSLDPQDSELRREFLQQQNSF